MTASSEGNRHQRPSRSQNEIQGSGANRVTRTRRPVQDQVRVDRWPEVARPAGVGRALRDGHHEEVIVNLPVDAGVEVEAGQHIARDNPVGRCEGEVRLGVFMLIPRGS
jgi:hypothetical protein